MNETIKCGAHIKKSLRDKFQKKVRKNKTTMNAEVKRFIESYVKS